MTKDLTPEEKDRRASLIAEGKLVPTEGSDAASSASTTWVWVAVGFIVLFAIAGGVVLGFMGGQFYSLFQPDQQRAEWLLGASLVEQGGDVVLENIIPGGPAYNAGVTSGDTLRTLGGDSIRSTKQAVRLINHYDNGDQVLVTLKHNYRTIQVNLLMGIYSEIPPTVIIVPPTPLPPVTQVPQLPPQTLSSARLGVYYRMLQEGDPFAVDNGALIVTILADDAPAAQAGLQTGDIITHVGRTAINNNRNLGDVLNDFSAGQRVMLTVNRGGNTFNVTVIMGGS